MAFYPQVLTKWWFWASLPIVLPLMFALDHTLSRYNQRYWRDRGQEPPRHRHSYRLDAGNFVLYAALTSVGAGIALVREQYAWAGGLAAGAVALGWLAVVQARRNVI